jgi:predicted small secreted protein
MVNRNRALSTNTQLRGGILLVLIATLQLAGCSGPKGVEKDIKVYIDKTCVERSPCVINLKDATPFAWDKMYVFKYTARQPEIEQAIGSKIKDYRELSRQFIFTKAGTVVLSEAERTNVEHPIKNEVVFEMPDSVNYQQYPSDTSFTVSKGSSEAGPYYLLQPTN